MKPKNNCITYNFIFRCCIKNAVDIGLLKEEFSLSIFYMCDIIATILLSILPVLFLKHVMYICLSKDLILTCVFNVKKGR